MTERMPNIGESAWHNILGANDGSGGFLRVTLNDDGTLRPTLGQTITPAALSANQDDWNPTGLSTASVIRASMNSTHNLTGLQGGTDGRAILLQNISGTGVYINLIHDATASASANRFYVSGVTPDTSFATIYPNTSVLLVYDGTSSKWRQCGGILKGGNTPQASSSTGNPGVSSWFSSEDHVHPTEWVASASYTPTLSQSATVTKTVTYARYMSVGKLVHVWFNLSATSSGTSGQVVLVGLPVTASSSSQGYVGMGGILNGGTVTRGVWWLQSTSTVAMERADTQGTLSFGADPSVQIVSGNTIQGFLTYEAA